LDELRASSSVSSGINCILLECNTLVSNNSRDLDRSCVLSGSHERILESTNETEHNQELFCRSCYGKKFGPKNYRYGGGRAGVPSMDDGTGSSLHVTFAAVSDLPDLRLRNHASKTTTNKLNNDRLTITV
jgi:hypothetical protein